MRTNCESYGTDKDVGPKKDLPWCFRFHWRLERGECDRCPHFVKKVQK